MSELVQVSLTNGRINPVIYRAHPLTKVAWVFTNRTYQASPWLLLYRQSMDDDDLDKLLVDRWGFSVDNMEMTLRRLYQYFRLDPDRVGTPYRDDAAPIRHAIKRGDLAAYSCPIEPLEKIHLPSHYIWSGSTRLSDYVKGSLNYQRHKIVYELGSVLKPRWDKFTNHNDLFYSESFANQQMIRVGAFMTGVGDSIANLFKALWDLGQLVVKVVGSTISAVVDFHTNLAKLDVDAIMQGVNELGIRIQGGIEGLKRLLKKAAALFNAVIGDSTVGQAVACYLDGMLESMTHVSKFKLAGGATFTIGLEVLLFMVSGGTANAAKWGVQAGSKTTKTAQTVTKADFFGPFPVNTLEMMADFGKERQKQIKSGEADTAPPIKIGDSKKATGPVADTKKPEAETAKPKPTTQVINERYGTNEAKWTVDERGRPISVEAKLDSTYNTSRSSTEKSLQSSAGGSARLSDDDGGHVIGHRFMSDQGEKNLFPQNANLNRSGYKKMENEWADWTDEGYEVKLKVDLHPPGSDRPTDIISEYEVFDPKTGNKVFEREHRFSNTAGEVFERVTKTDMQSFR